MKKLLWILFAAFAFAALPVSCKDPVPTPEEPEDITEPVDTTDVTPPINPEDLEPLALTVSYEGDCIYANRPEFFIHAENPNEVAVSAEIKMDITTDLKAQVADIVRTIEVPAKGEADFTLSTDSDLEPGFYRARVIAYKKVLMIPVFGIRPFEIVSAPDKQPDFDEFWEAAKDQLHAIDMKPNLIELTQKSSSKCKVYMVEIQSVPDGLEGDPVTVRGYYLEPQDGKPHPVIMHFFGYDTRGTFVNCPGANNGDYAEFYLSHRGQYINRAPASKRGDGLDMDFSDDYGDWFAFNFGKRDGYYYRGAFLDCVQAVNFMATRETSDMNNLFAEGSSQGGALSYACAALSDYPFTAIAQCVAFLGDFPDYFKIVSWPGDVAKNCAKAAGISDEEMYKFLSYFDTKNLATRIHCAVMACSGLKDGTCPPHTNIAPFNNLPGTDKEYYFYPEMTHSIPGDWNSKMSKFFKARLVQ